MKITIKAYDTAWAARFDQLREELSSILEAFHPQIEHFGSTSVPGLAAKPIIDILVGLPDIQDVHSSITPMMQHHYIYYAAYNTLMSDRRLFVRLKGKDDHDRFQEMYTQAETIPHEEINPYKLAHVHVRELGTPEWIRHIAFRDYLKTHPEVRQQYEQLKRKLSRKVWKDGNAYNQAKDSFIKAEERKAVAWYSRKRFRSC